MNTKVATGIERKYCAPLQADERLLLEGQYEQARLQLEAARPRSAEEDDDVSEYIRSDAEVRCCNTRTSCDYKIVYLFSFVSETEAGVI